MTIAHLVSLNWDHPLPTAVVALTLRPLAVTLIAPRAAEDGAERLKLVLARHGIAVTVALGEDATDLDRGAPDAQMRAVITSALAGDPTTVLDYTGGSKLMAAAARLAIEPDGDERAVYLDARGVLRWDDGREQEPSEVLELNEIAALHGSRLEGGGSVLAERPDLAEAISDGARIVAAMRARMRPLFWREIAREGELARTGKSRATASVRDALEKLATGQAYMLPIMPGNKGDWLEAVAASAVERALVHHGARASVRIGVYGQRRETDVLVEPELEFHPAVLELVRAMRRASTGIGSLDELQNAADDLLHGQDTPSPRDQSSDHDFEIDVVALSGHRIRALSCMAGDDPEKVRWKSREIARRAVQIGGELARSAFVCLLDHAGCEQLRAELAGSDVPGASAVTVFGVDDLVDWTAEPPRFERLADFLGLAPSRVEGQVIVPDEVDHDLLVTVGGTPLPIFQAVLAHGARRPLLLHTEPTARAAARVADALALRSIDAVRVQARNPFAAAAVDEVLALLPPSPALDITGGTKVLSSRALLQHAGAPSTVTYVDGRHGVVRSLSPGADELPLPSVSVSEAVALRGWTVERSRSAATHAEIPRSLDTVPAQDALEWLGARLASELGDDAEVLLGVTLTDAAGRREEVPLIARWRWRVAVVHPLWEAGSSNVAQGAWPVLRATAVMFGDYARIVLLTKLDDEECGRVLRQLQRRSAGASPVQLLGREALRAGNDAAARLLLDALMVT
jgi:hypothetical protein